MAKAAKKVSWRTLMRRAKDEEKAGHKKVAASLRAEAAGMRKGTRSKTAAISPTKTARRSSVAKKGWATRRAKKLVVADALAPRAEAEAINAVRDDWHRLSGVSARVAADTDTANDNRSAPGRGEIVGGAEHQFAEEIAKLARKKGGKDAIQNMITERIARARAEGQNLAERGRSELAKKTHDAHCDKVVCGALATWDLAEAIGGLPPSIVISGYTVARIIDVLNRHGYTRDGRIGS